MALDCFTNRVGTFAKDGSYFVTQTTLDENGTTTRSTTDLGLLREGWSQKPAATKVKTRFIDGVPWRDPTNYHRTVEKYVYTPTTTVNTVWYNATHWIKTTRTGVAMNGPQNLDHAMVRPSLGILNTSARDQVVTEALLKLNKGKVNYGQYIAESRKSANELARTGRELLTLLRHVKRGEVHKLPRDFGTVRRKSGEYWLRWNYGWKPLASDIHGMFENSKGMLRSPQIMRVTRNVRSHYDGSFTHNGQPATFGVDHVDRCRIWARMKDSAFFYAQNMGLVNPLSLGWELVPYSFVLDWFVPVGDYLEALTAHAGLDFVAGYRSQSRQASFTMIGKNGILKKQVFCFRREKLNAFPAGRIYASASPFSTNRVISALALYNQMLPLRRKY